MFAQMKKPFTILSLLAAASILVQVSCTTTPMDLTKANIIPKPVSVVQTGESFKLTGRTNIYVQGESAELMQIGQLSGR